jgi:hypothetical protein
LAFSDAREPLTWPPWICSQKKMRPLAQICHHEILQLADARLPLLSEPTRQELKR